MSSPPLASWAPAKVNLFLHVGPVQPNGRHPLDSLVVFAGTEAADRLGVEAADGLSLEISGPSAEGLEAGPDNLVLKAAMALREAADVTAGAAFRLEKSLPVAAGIGGGSADAAAALRLLTELWRTDPAFARSVAPALGGDVPVALHGGPALMQGEGEQVVPVPQLPPVPALLANPGIACPTGPVFRAYDAAGGGAEFRVLASVPEFARTADLIEWLGHQRNDLERPAVALVPQIAKVLEDLAALPGARLARMSGSGATCFALFDRSDDAEAAAAHLRLTHPDWWIRATQLGAAP
ncbi:MAG TPA: 4-(cytidine 5'-diphospho)-2-C-methyl-D-erythritol kinase [Hyphomonas sp.]|nr:4-(cytidine 5'-diphospho)-2-C-methyl-D-erythritol kinase [Hyphomonas sp.]HPE47505.1 4-(cytidine 5'-diphospho)-2-C-methyl-D-erythritol kinase [Hyphomonas sp.]